MLYICVVNKTLGDISLKNLFIEMFLVGFKK